MMPKARPHQAYIDQNQNTLLLSKLRPPRLTSALIERPVLLSLLDRVLACPLTLLSAPAGFGKTTVLQQWLGERQCQADFPPLAWVSLDEGDNDPLRFWGYIFAASQTFQPHPPALSPLQGARAAAPFGPQAPQQWVSAFVNEITRLDCQGVLVLEDYHVIHEQQIQQTLTFLIDQLPPALHLVLITRTDPPFSLARLRANHQLLEIHASQLAFSRAETLSFLQQTLPFDLPETVLAQIEEQMEGWIAGLRLFTLGFQGRTTPSEIQQLLSSFTGRHHYLLEYFLTEVLSAQPEAVQTFLLQTSHLQRLCAPLCDRVTGGQESEQILAEIERAGLFFQAIADSEGWYRYHALFAEAMRHEASLRLGEAHMALCLERAQSWYEHNGLLEEAIEIALQRRAFTDVLVLLERLLERSNAFLRERIYAIVRWLRPVPEALLATSPLLCFAYASALTFSSSSDRLEAATFAHVMTLLQYAEEQWQVRQQMTSVAEVSALRAMIFVRQGKIPEAAHAARQALALLSPEQILWRVICQTTLAIEARWLGHFQDAYQTMLPGLFTFGDAQEQEGNIVLKLFLGELCLEQGALYKAEALFQTALQEAEGLNDQARALIGIAQLAYERNQLAQARKQAQQALAISTDIHDRPLQVQATLILARIAYAYGSMQEAMKMLQALLLQLDPAQFLQQYREVSLWQMRFELASGNTLSVQRWLSSLESEAPPVVSRLQQEQEALLQARLLLHNGEAHNVPGLLKPWQKEAVSKDRLRSALEIGLVLSFAYHQLKDPQEARKQLSEVIRSAHSEHYLRLFLDEGEIVTTVLSAQLAATREKSLQTFIRTILQAFDSKQERPAASVSDPASLLASLSPQERQVLRLLLDGMERQAIAEHLVISLNTVKTHLQRLYQKLHVNNRFEAIEVARSLDITD